VVGHQCHSSVVVANRQVNREVDLCQGQSLAAVTDRAKKVCNYGRKAVKVAIAGLAVAMDDVAVGREDSLVWWKAMPYLREESGQSQTTSLGTICGCPSS
jgi:hypothetical protein